MCWCRPCGDFGHVLESITSKGTDAILLILCHMLVQAQVS